MKTVKLNLKYLPFRLFLATIILIAGIWLILDITALRVPIFGFHSIVDVPDKKDLKLNPKIRQMDYAKQDLLPFLDYLVSHNFWFLSTQEFSDYFVSNFRQIPAEHIGQRPTMISFDDSYKTYYTNLLPILESLENKYSKKIKVVLFINPGTLVNYESKTAYNITCNNLREGLKKGFFDLQSHGQNHKKLTTLNSQELNYELEAAQTQLRKCTADLDPKKMVASHIAYPFGAVDKKVERLASKYYKSGYLYNSQIFKQGWLKSKYLIPRFSVNMAKSPQRLIQMAERAMKLKIKG